MRRTSSRIVRRPTTLGLSCVLALSGTMAAWAKPRPPAPAANAGTPATRPAHDFATTTALRMRVPAVDFRAVPLVDVLDFIRDTTNINLAVNWAALEAAGVDRNAPVTLRLRNVSLSRVLNLILSEAAHGGEPLSWYIADDVVHVTTKAISDRQMITRVYPVQDLLVDVPNFVGPNFTIGSGSGGSSSPPISGDGATDGEQETLQERGEKLVALIQQVVDPDVWVDNGGFASIRYFNGHLIVTAPRDTQIKIGG